jgi:hypothetical protein
MALRRDDAVFDLMWQTVGANDPPKAKMMMIIIILPPVLVRAEGLEPSRPCSQRILSPLRLPFRHARLMAF